jgi:hypothetical protein
MLIALQDHALGGGVLGELERQVQHRLVLDDAGGLDAEEAETTTVGRASSMRVANSWPANPPNTTECTAPRRAQASMAMTASGTIGM